MSAGLATDLGVVDTGRHSALLGLGAYRPRRVVPNADLVERIESSDEWIRTRSGIATRRWADPDETLVAMSAAAAHEALEAAGITAADVDTVIVATMSHLQQAPSVSALLAHEIGATPAAAFDLGAACAGFCHGVAVASDLVRAHTSRYALVVGVERMSDILDLDDRSTAFIFGDGAGAVVVGASAEPGIGRTVWGSDGSRSSLIAQTTPYDRAFADDSRVWPTLGMEGNPVFRWASFTMADVATRALDAAGVTVDELDVFVPHQANMRITDAMARSIGLGPDVEIARDVADQGNASAASVPLALHRLYAEGRVKSGQLALLIAFGAGLAYAAQVVRLP